MSKKFLSPIKLAQGASNPSTGSAGELFYNTTDTKIYAHNGTAWVPSGGGVTVGASRPSTAIAGDAWFDSNDGTLYVYYTDASGSQWVQVQANSALEGSILARLGGVESRATALETAQKYALNYLINGSFDIWQRGTSFSAAGYTADRWAIVGASGQTVSVSQQTFTPGTAPVSGYEGTYYSRVAWSGTPSGTFWYTQKVEDVRTLAGQTATLSFWAKASSNTSVFVPVLEQNFGVGGSGVVTTVSSSIALSTSWQRFSVVFSVPSVSGKTIGTSSYLEVRPLYGGNSVNGINIDIWGVQLEAGALATPFRRNSPNIQSELAACQRYYERISGGFAVSIVSSFSAYGTGAQTISLRTKQTLRANPSVAGSNIEFERPGVGSTSLSSIAIGTYSSADSPNVTFTPSSALTAGAMYNLRFSTTGYLEFNAEL